MSKNYKFFSQVGSGSEFAKSWEPDPDHLYLTSDKVLKP